MSYTITITKRPTMAQIKQKTEYIPRGEWDWSNLTKEEILERIEQTSREAEKSESVTTEVFFKDFERRHHLCITK